MGEGIEIAIEGALGVLTLNRPEAINALTLPMILALETALRVWLADDAIGAVLLEGRGPRGFCAGGDVRAVRSLVLGGESAEAEAFFEAEYRLNALIATYPKPVVALTHGAVMGGGIGLAGHAGFRICVPDTRFAMPEGAIGFIVDTGVHSILAKATLERALLFCLAGQPVGPADGLALGLVDCLIAPDRRDVVRAGIAHAAQSASVETALVLLMSAESIDAGEPEFCLEADRLAAALAEPDAVSIIAAIASLPGTEPLIELLASRSPASLEAILQSQHAARAEADLAKTLGRDLRLARFFIAQPDFAEGVRAVLVDKDRAPRWNPAQLTTNDVETLRKIVETPSYTADTD